MRQPCLGILAAAAAASGAVAQQPAPGPATVKFDTAVGTFPPGAATAQTLSYRTDASSRMTVHVKLDQAGPFNFLVDTGADRTVVSRSVAGRLNLGDVQSATLHSTTGQQTVRTTAIDRLEFSAKTVRNLRAAVLDDVNIGADGILGIDSLRSERVTFDFAKGTMTIVPSAVRPERFGRDEIVVRGKLRAGRLVLTQARAGVHRMNVVIDTGADMSIGNPALYRALRRTGLLKPLGRVQMLSVTGELLSGDLMALERFEVGGIIVRDLNVVFADAHTFKTLKLQDKPALLMGMNTLKAFQRVSIDFANRKFRVLVPEESSLPGLQLASR